MMFIRVLVHICKRTFFKMMKNWDRDMYYFSKYACAFCMDSQVTLLCFLYQKSQILLFASIYSYFLVHNGLFSE